MAVVSQNRFHCSYLGNTHPHATSTWKLLNSETRIVEICLNDIFDKSPFSMFMHGCPILGTM